MANKFLIILGVIAIAACSPAHTEIQVIPLVNGQFSLGRSSLGSDASSGGNLMLDVTPVVRFNERTSLLPRVSVNYNGVLSANQVVDYGNLYQQLMDSLVSLKLVHVLAPRSLKVRIEAGHKKELARETNDEAWWNGLYDYNNTFYTLGLEKNIGPGTVGIGYRYSSFIFPNYTTLSSQQGQDFMGVHTFDNDVSRIFFTTLLSLSRRADRRFLFDLSASFDSINYPDQRIVDSSASYLADKRKDSVVSVNPAFVFSSFNDRRDASFGLNFGFRTKTSNQNNYDVDNFTYIPKYFDYSEGTVEPFVTVKFHPVDWRLRVGYAFSNKNYAERLVQDENGTYTGDKTYVRNGYLTLRADYPLFRNMGVTFLVSSNNSSSNHKFEKYYKYNFTATNVLLGLTYEY